MSGGVRVGAIAAGVVAYLSWAAVASTVVKRFGGDLAKLERRSASATLLIGAAANLLILATALLLTVLVLGRRLLALGFRASASDLLFAAVGAAVTFGSATAFLFVVRGRRLRRAPTGSQRALALALLVLAVVAVQEEVLFRGYLALALRGLGPVMIVAVTTAIFVAIHIPTNPVNRWQLFGWALGGLLLILAYLLSGSLWVAIALHFAIDAANVLVFRITRSDGLFAVEPPLAASERAAYRCMYTVLVGALLVLWYGAALRA